MTGLRGTLAAVAVPLFLIGACARPGNQAAASGDAPLEKATVPVAASADDLVLRTESIGGFVRPDFVIGRIPAVSVYGDGRVITDGPVPAIYPGPALPNVQQRMITPELVRQLVQEGLSAGVRTGADFGRPNVADAPSTRVTVRTANGIQQATAEALQEGRADDPMLTQAQRDARTKLAAYVKKLRALGEGDSTAYVPTQVAVLAQPWTSPGNDQPKPQAKPWTGPQLPGPILNENIGIGCVILSGNDRDQALTVAAAATSETPWTVGSQKWTIKFRPLLPDEKNGCAVLKAGRG